MKHQKFVVDLSTIELTETQVNEIQSGIEEIVTGILIRNATTENLKMSPLSSEFHFGGGVKGIAFTSK